MEYSFPLDYKMTLDLNVPHLWQGHETLKTLTAPKEKSSTSSPLERQARVDAITLEMEKARAALYSYFDSKSSKYSLSSASHLINNAIHIKRLIVSNADLNTEKFCSIYKKILAQAFGYFRKKFAEPKLARLLKRTFQFMSQAPKGSPTVFSALSYTHYTSLYKVNSKLGLDYYCCLNFLITDFTLLLEKQFFVLDDEAHRDLLFEGMRYKDRLVIANMLEKITRIETAIDDNISRSTACYAQLAEIVQSNLAFQIQKIFGSIQVLDDLWALDKASFKACVKKNYFPITFPVEIQDACLFCDTIKFADFEELYEYLQLTCQLTKQVIDITQDLRRMEICNRKKIAALLDRAQSLKTSKLTYEYAPTLVFSSLFNWPKLVEKHAYMCEKIIVNDKSLSLKELQNNVSQNLWEAAVNATKKGFHKLTACFYLNGQAIFFYKLYALYKNLLSLKENAPTYVETSELESLLEAFRSFPLEIFKAPLFTKKHKALLDTLEKVTIKGPKISGQKNLVGQAALIACFIPYISTCRQDIEMISQVIAAAIQINKKCSCILENTLNENILDMCSQEVRANITALLHTMDINNKSLEQALTEKINYFTKIKKEFESDIIHATKELFGSPKALKFLIGKKRCLFEEYMDATEEERKLQSPIDSIFKGVSFPLSITIPIASLPQNFILENLTDVETFFNLYAAFIQETLAKISACNSQKDELARLICHLEEKIKPL